MDTSINKLIDIVIVDHKPNPPLSSRSIARHERRFGHPLPSDLRQFYERCNGASLFSGKDGHPFRIMPLHKVNRTRIYIFGRDTSDWAPESWYAICDMSDSNYIGVDLAFSNSNSYPVIDCFHESHGTHGDDQIIALSFTEFLQCTLASKGKPYWLQRGFKSYGAALKAK